MNTAQTVTWALCLSIKWIHSACWKEIKLQLEHNCETNESWIQLKSKHTHTSMINMTIWANWYRHEASYPCVCVCCWTHAANCVHNPWIVIDESQIVRASFEVKFRCAEHVHNKITNQITKFFRHFLSHIKI